jgi:hypothetical protein
VANWTHYNRAFDALVPLENRSNSVYNNEIKNRVRREKLGFLLKLIDENKLCPENTIYIGLPGDSFLLEKALVKLKLFTPGKMILVDRNAKYKSKGFKVRKGEVQKVVSDAMNEGHRPISFADLDLCSQMTIQPSYSGGICSLERIFKPVVVHGSKNQLISLTATAAREWSGISASESYVRMQRHRLRKPTIKKLESFKVTAGQRTRAYVAAIAMKKAVNMCAKTTFDIIDCTFYRAQKTPMMTMSFLIKTVD